MNEILEQTRTYSHDNGLGKPHTYLYECNVGSTMYECVNGKVVQNNGKESIFIGNATTKVDFAFIINKKESGHKGVIDLKKLKASEVVKKIKPNARQSKILKIKLDSKIPMKWNREIIAENMESGQIIEFETMTLARDFTGYKCAKSLKRLIENETVHKGWKYTYKKK